MKVGLLYDSTTGEILNVIRASSISLLELQASSPVSKILIPPDNFNIAGINPELLDKEQWLIKNDRPVRKVIAEISSDRNTIISNGVDSCIITVSNLDGPQIVDISGDKIEVSPGDNTISMASEVPRTFKVSLEYNLTCWAAPIEITAT